MVMGGISAIITNNENSYQLLLENPLTSYKKLFNRFTARLSTKNQRTVLQSWQNKKSLSPVPIAPIKLSNGWAVARNATNGTHL